MLLDLLKSVLYGIVEGVTEWLPISSTGHLILLEDIMPFKTASADFYEMFQVVIQFGAIIAVVILFWNKLWPFYSKNSKNTKPLVIGNTQISFVKNDTIILWLKVLAAILPAAVIGLFADDWLNEHLYNKITVCITLILYGVLFIVVERYNSKRSPSVTNLSDINYSTAFIIGIFQALAMIPGTSRSGATILGAILIGASRPVAAEFSFFLAVPTMLGASLLKMVKFLKVGFNGSGEILILLVGTIVSILVSLVVIRALMAYVKKKDFSFFGYYRIALGIIVLLAAVLTK